MNALCKWASVVVVVSCVTAVGNYIVRAQAAAGPAQTQDTRARLAFAHALPQMEGGHLKISLVEVVYGPGASSPPHSHPCPVIGYVAEGAIRTQVKGEPEAVYKAGETFYEPPNGVHQISGNASNKEPAKLLAYFVCDHDAPLSGPPTDAKAPK